MVNAVFLESCALLPFRFYGFLCKPNGIVLNDIGNVFLTRTVYTCMMVITLLHNKENSEEHDLSRQCIAGSSCGVPPLSQLLASVGMDDYHSLNVWDWRKGKVVASTRGHSDRVS